MRIFSNVTEMFNELERELFEMGIDNHPNTMQDKVVKQDDSYLTKELMSYCYMLTRWKDIDSCFDLLDNDLKVIGIPYCEAEFHDRISAASNPGNSYKVRPELWSRFLEPDGKFSYTYSERMDPQLSRIIEELNVNPTSRQCVLPLYDYHLDLSGLGGKHRVPCSMYYQFLRRTVSGQDKLSLIYTMRSCDLYNHFLIDVYLGIKLLEYVAEKVGSEAYSFTHFMGSLHAYKRDWKYRRIF